jgi:hypothetical protein
LSQLEQLGCSHENRIFLVTYKSINLNGKLSEESPKALCQECYENPDFNNSRITDIIFNIKTGEIIK